MNLRPLVAAAVLSLTSISALPAFAQSNAEQAQARYNTGDFPAARALYEKACMTDGKDEACHNLGSMAWRGQGGAKDPVQARDSDGFWYNGTVLKKRGRGSSTVWCKRR